MEQVLFFFHGFDSGQIRTNDTCRIMDVLWSLAAFFSVGKCLSTTFVPVPVAKSLEEAARLRQSGPNISTQVLNRVSASLPLCSALVFLFFIASGIHSQLIQTWSKKHTDKTQSEDSILDSECALSKWNKLNFFVVLPYVHTQRSSFVQYHVWFI